MLHDPPPQSGAARSFLAICILAFVAVAVGCASSKTPFGDPGASPNSHGAARAFALVTVAPTGIYLGAQVDPSYPPGVATFSQQEAETEGLETNMGRKLALHMEYRYWRDLVNPALNGTLMNDPEFAADVKYGRVPVISLHCIDDINDHNYNLTQIASGIANADLASLRAALLTLKYTDGKQYPVMLRYFWEFNLNANDLGNENGNGGCFQRPSPTATSLPYQFTNAWAVVHSQLLGVGSPLPDITFVWNPNVIDAANDPPSPTSFDAYFPGQNEVDWIGADGYSKLGPQNHPLSFHSIFDNFIADIQASPNLYGQKPLLIGETGSCTIYPYPDDQADYLIDLQTVLDGTPGAPSYGAVRGVIYFDAQGQYNIHSQLCDWSLDGPAQSPAITGLQAFENIGHDPNFKSMVVEQ